MKKMIFMGFVIATLIAVSFVRADQVNMNISVNGTSNLNISVNADDSLAREAINNISADVYGTTTGSGPKDLVLDEIMRGYGNPVNISNDSTEINAVCSEPYLQQYLSKVSALPPDEFVTYLKGMGYDDEDHISFIWNICQQQYINEHEAQWSQNDAVQAPEMANIIQNAIDWLIGTDTLVPPQSQQIAIALSSYFASKNDVMVLVNRINQQDLRIQALERAMEQIGPEAYCQAKLDLMKEYNLTGVKCGVNSTYYWNAEKAGFDNYSTIAYTTCTPDWTCTDWSGCVNGVQGRTCVDKNDCGIFDSKPLVARVCTVLEQTQQQTVKASAKTDTTAPALESEPVNPLTKLSKTSFIVSIGFLMFVMVSIFVESKKIARHKR